jgi:hypothetical protein
MKISELTGNSTKISVRASLWAGQPRWATMSGKPPKANPTTPSRTGGRSLKYQADGWHKPTTTSSAGDDNQHESNIEHAAENLNPERPSGWAVEFPSGILTSAGTSGHRKRETYLDSVF